VLVVSAPLFSDIFGSVWKTSQCNDGLLSRHLAETDHNEWLDSGFLLLLDASLVLVFAVPEALAVWLVLGLAHVQWVHRLQIDSRTQSEYHPRYNRNRTSGRSAAW
jgi:hypothetical protein